MRRVGAADYRELHRISIEEPDRFWPVLVDDLGIEFSRPWDAVVDLTRGPEWATWFVGGQVNIARACLHRFAGDGEAFVGLYEDGGRESLSFAEASRRVTQLAEALVELGVREGDRVALYMPMCPAVEVDSEAPYLLAYTSGTTGRPKGALLVQGGFLVSIAREVAYQTDVKQGDRLHFATDMGWIMGPWTVVGGGALGATIVFAEGAPDRPDDRLWRLVESERVTMLGLSPTLVRALIPKGEPRADLSSLRALCTTGEPWNPDPDRWRFEHVGRSRAPIVNISGGTEVGACFLTTVITEPIKPVAVGFPALGQDMDVVDQSGAPVRGEVGELVCRRPWPGMTRGVWGDSERYLDTYWRRFPGVWTHGDWASIDDDGYWYLHGRSDDTLNIAGKRIGPAELESAAIGSGIVA